MGKHIQIFIILFLTFFSLQTALVAQSSLQGSPNQSEISVDELKVFPNPTSDYFQINSGQNIKKVIVYNMFGKEVKSFYHYTNAQHDVNDLKAGMYIVKMIDERNKIVKSIKLHKNFAGV